MPRWAQTYTVFSNAAGDGARRVFFSIGQRPSLLSRIAMFLIVATAFGLALVVLVPVMLLGIVVLGGLWFCAALRGLMRRVTGANGPLDGRRNVRVIDRD
jgi:hypothetical protein